MSANFNAAANEFRKMVTLSKLAKKGQIRNKSQILNDNYIRDYAEYLYKQGKYEQKTEGEIMNKLTDVFGKNMANKVKRNANEEAQREANEEANAIALQEAEEAAREQERIAAERARIANQERRKAENRARREAANQEARRIAQMEANELARREEQLRREEAEAREVRKTLHSYLKKLMTNNSQKWSYPIGSKRGLTIGNEELKQGFNQINLNHIHSGNTAVMSRVYREHLKNKLNKSEKNRIQNLLAKTGNSMVIPTGIANGRPYVPIKKKGGSKSRTKVTIGKDGRKYYFRNGKRVKGRK